MRCIVRWNDDDNVDKHTVDEENATDDDPKNSLDVVHHLTGLN